MTDQSGSSTNAELDVVTALRSLSVFTADQAGAYREHFRQLAEVLGPDVSTKLREYLLRWAASGEPGCVVLTGNAGTGKTALAEAFSETVGGRLPSEDAFAEVAPGRWVVKDLSGLPASQHAETLRRSVSLVPDCQTLLCANEGVLRDAITGLGHAELDSTLDEALRSGAARLGHVTVVNLNRQRPTAEGLWRSIVEYLTRESLWAGCAACDVGVASCPMASNVRELRRQEVREQARLLFRLGTGEAVPTLREVLAIVSWAIVGKLSCEDVRERVRDRGPQVYTASEGYFDRILGGGLQVGVAERSPLLSGIRATGLGALSDLEVDTWLRDSGIAEDIVQALAGRPTTTDSEQPAARRALEGTRSPLDRVATFQGVLTFHSLGEMVSTDEDPTRVEDGVEAIVRGAAANSTPAQSLWRERVFFEAAAALGGSSEAARRLLLLRHAGDLLELASKAARRVDTILELTEVVRGLNFLVTGFGSANEGLIVPDPACLFARDPGSYRPARPSLIHSLVLLEQLSIEVPDRGLVNELLDVDYIDVLLVVGGERDEALRIGPKMYEAIREAAEYGGPVGQGVAEMNDLRSFYGRLAKRLDGSFEAGGLRVADPESTPPSLVKITLPHFLEN